MFNHSCGTTLALPVSTFEDMYKGEIASQRATGTPACPGHCLYQKELGSCPATCECNYVREIIQLIRQPAAPTTETQAEH